MTTPTEITSKSRLHSVAVVLASLIIPVPLIMGRIVEAILDTWNPAELDDVTVPLAYLSEILIWSFSTLAIVLIAFIVATAMLYRRKRTMASVSLPLTVGIVQILLGVLIIVFEQIVSVAGS